MTKPYFTSKSDEWATPQDLYDSLDAEFHFNLDPCSTNINCKCKKHFTPEQDGLKQNWGGVSSILQPTVQQNRRVDREVLPRRLQRQYACSAVNSGKDRHKVFPQLHKRSGRNTIYKRPVEVRRQHKFSTVPINGCDI